MADELGLREPRLVVNDDPATECSVDQFMVTHPEALNEAVADAVRRMSVGETVRVNRDTTVRRVA